MALALSILAILTTFYQAHLQRSHNQKSVKPLIQVDLIDRNGLLAIYVRNNGIGPYIVTKLEFSYNGNTYTSIEDFLTLDPKNYHFIPVTELTTKIIQPASLLEIFSMQRNSNDTDQDIDDIRRQLAPYTLKVKGHDIYDNEVIIERNFNWFVKYNAA